MKLNLNCQRSVGVLEKIPYVGEGGMDTYWNPRMAKGPSIHFFTQLRGLLGFVRGGSQTRKYGISRQTHLK